MHKFIGHLGTINRHKWKITIMCFKCGLYKQGLLHDLSKYSWIEFSSGVKYFQGNRSPVDKEKEIHGVSLGWLHHKGRNKHHWEYWMDNAQGGLRSVEMPTRYVVEMYCDRVVASKTYQRSNYTDSSAYDYFMNGQKYIDMKPKTKALLEKLLTYHKIKGEKATIKYIKNNILK